jgi:hypothetical protein
VDNNTDLICRLEVRIDRLEHALSNHKEETISVNNSLIRLEERFINIAAAIDQQRIESTTIRTGITISTISAIIAASVGIFIVGMKVTALPPSSTTTTPVVQAK